MKSIIFILALAAMAVATPLPADNMKDDAYMNTTTHPEKMVLDLEEQGIEFFPNGTVKQGSIEELLRIYYMMKDADDYAGNKTDAHIEEGDEEEEEGLPDGRDKRTIFGSDNRRHITSYCPLALTSNGCTALFIGPNHALTSGGCVYDRRTGRFRTGLSLRRARNCRQSGAYMTATRLFTVNGYALHGLEEYDYGLIVTTQRSSCWAGFGYRDPWDNRGLDLLAYTTSRSCFYDIPYISSCSYSSTIRNDLLIRHRCDTTSSVVGAALTSVDGGTRRVYGVNSYYGQLYNYGARIDRAKFYRIVDWMQQTGYYPSITLFGK